MLSILAIIILNIILINAIENIVMYYIFTALINGLILLNKIRLIYQLIWTLLSLLMFLIKKIIHLIYISLNSLMKLIRGDYK